MQWLDKKIDALIKERTKHLDGIESKFLNLHKDSIDLLTTKIAAICAGLDKTFLATDDRIKKLEENPIVVDQTDRQEQRDQVVEILKKLISQRDDLVKLKAENIEEHASIRNEVSDALLLIMDRFKNIEIAKADIQELSNHRSEMHRVLLAGIDTLNQDIAVKISGLMQYVRDKLSNVKAGGDQDVELLKKLAKLEDIKDSIEHRRSTEEIVSEIESLKQELASADRDNFNVDKINYKISILKWVLGGSHD